MIIIQIIGGLGNQLFQYAFGRHLALLHHETLKLDLTAFETYKLHQYSLNHFNIQSVVANADEISRFKPLKGSNINNLTFKIKKKAGFSKVFSESGFHFNEHALKFPSDAYVQGYWQSEKYFKDIASIIRKDLTIITIPDEINSSAIKHIDSTEAVSIHIRRGDYISDPKANQVHGICGLDYYQRSVEWIVEKLSQPHFFIFSDDPDWVKENLKLKHPHTFISHNNSKTNYEDMRLMSTCKHHIIANSSFSWWGAWLNPNANKIVITPQKWFNSSERNTKDLIPEHWIAL